jgi:hypothetical protein
VSAAGRASVLKILTATFVYRNLVLLRWGSSHHLRSACLAMYSNKQMRRKLGLEARGLMVTQSMMLAVSRFRAARNSKIV